jgi:hypothetical protein
MTNFFLISIFTACEDKHEHHDTGEEPMVEPATEPATESAIEPATEPSSEEVEDITIKGTWVNDTETYIITNESVSSTTVWEGTTYGPYEYVISQYSNSEMYIIAESDPDTDGVTMWNRFDWYVSDDSLFLCNTIYNATTEEEALLSEAADTTDPANSGCGGFAWSSLVVQ